MAFGKVNDLVGWVLQLVDDPYTLTLIVIEYSGSSVKTCSCVFLCGLPRTLVPRDSQLSSISSKPFLNGQPLESLRSGTSMAAPDGGEGAV